MLGAGDALNLNGRMEDTKLSFEFTVDLLPEFICGFFCVLLNNDMRAECIIVGTQRPDVHIVYIFYRIDTADMLGYGLGVRVFRRCLQKNVSGFFCDPPSSNKNN